MNFVDELKMNFVKAEGLFRLMAINIGVFLAISLFKLIMFLSGNPGGLFDQVLNWLSLPAAAGRFILQPWSIITYMFLHEGFFHILFNMIILYWSGKLFCEMLGSNRVVVVYLMGGLWGALMFMLMYNIMPAFNESVNFSVLMGASAGVVAVLCAIATLVPDYTIHLLIIGPVRLKYIAIFLVVLYLISIPNGNAGGNISHIGGALYGYLYTKALQSGGNPGSVLSGLFSWLQGTRAGKLKKVHDTGKSSPGRSAVSKQEVIDNILDKISRSGYESLSKSEKETLFKASNQGNDGK